MTIPITTAHHQDAQDCLVLVNEILNIGGIYTIAVQSAYAYLGYKTRDRIPQMLHRTVVQELPNTTPKNNIWDAATRARVRIAASVR